MNTTKEKLLSKTSVNIESLPEGSITTLAHQLLTIIALQNKVIHTFYEEVYTVDPYLAEEAIGKAAEHLYEDGIK